MKQLCNKACQLRLDGKIVMIGRGAVVEYKDEHPCLVPFDKVGVDFVNGSEAELKAAKWTWDEANEAMLEEFDKGLNPDKGKSKAVVVEQIMDIRYRAI